MNPLPMLGTVFLSVALLTACVARSALVADEGHRIDEVMNREPDGAEVKGASGIAINQAPAVASPPKPMETYRFSTARRRVSARAPRQSRADSVVLR